MADHATNNQDTMEEVHQPDPGHAEEGSPLLALDPGMVVWTWLIFFVFLIVLREYAWKPILDSLDERETSIRKASDDAQAAREALEAASAEQRELISDGRQRAAAAIDEARGVATEAAEEIRKSARAESDKIIGEAQAEIEAQQKEAVATLRSEMGGLSVLVASKLLDADLDDDRNRALVEDYISALPD